MIFRDFRDFQRWPISVIFRDFPATEITEALSLSQAVEGEWRRWVHPLSPNAQFAWRSLLPSLFAKSLWYAWSVPDVINNLRSLVWNLVLAGYPQSWWKPSFHRCWEKFRLPRMFPLQYMHDWIRDARESKGSG